MDEPAPRLDLGLDEPTRADVGSELMALQRDAATLLRGLEGVARIKAQSPSALDDLEKALRDLPTAEAMAKGLEEVRHRGAGLLEQSGKTTRRDFLAIEAAFIRDQQAANVAVRETHQGWRVGSLEMETRTDRSRVRFRYNQAELLDWSTVRSKTNLEALLQKARGMLEGSKLRADLFAQALSEAFEYCKLNKKSRGDLVAIRDIYPELRLALMRHELGRRPEKVLKNAAFPSWAFLYNLDLYRNESSPISADKRLAFTTGSQSDTAKIGVVLNGLHADQEYKVFCFVQRSSHE
jgi:hypothetical protein